MTRVHAQAAILGLLDAPPPGVSLSAEIAHHVISEVWAREHAFNDREERKRRRDQPERQVPAAMLHGLLLWLKNEAHNEEFCGATLALIFVVLDFQTDDMSRAQIAQYHQYVLHPDAEPAGELVERIYGEIVMKKFEDARGETPNT